MPQTKEQKRISYLKNAEAIKERSRIYRINNAEKVRERNRRYRAKNKEKANEWAKKSQAKNRDRCQAYWKKYYQEHKDESAARTRKWAKENPDKIAAYSKARREKDIAAARAKEKHWRDSSPERVSIAQRRRKIKKKTNSTFEEIQAADSKIKALRAIPFTACAYCSKFFLTSKMHVEHVRPISRGGKHSPENILMACLTCNVRKSDRLLFEEWIPSKPTTTALMYRVFTPPTPPPDE
jgi:5-methylcytosine-specific restriction endonuclease McrA